MCNNINPVIGLYEKALPSWLSWKEKLKIASDAGYSFMEISIDETDERLSRLNWDMDTKMELQDAMNTTGVPILTMCLSAHRKFPIGSENKNIRDQGMEIMEKAIRFSRDIGIRVIQLAAYDVFYDEVSTEKTREKFYENLKKSVELAGKSGITLALETMDSKFTDSVTKLMEIVRVINSPWLQVYPDVGNLAASNKDLNFELLRGEGHIVAIHLKDTKPGVYRLVPFGQGIVNFEGVFKLLDSMDYKGLFLIEMWSDDSKDSIKTVKDAREWIVNRWKASYS